MHSKDDVESDLEQFAFVPFECFENEMFPFAHKFKNNEDQTKMILQSVKMNWV